MRLAKLRTDGQTPRKYQYDLFTQNVNKHDKYIYLLRLFPFIISFPNT